ncbi:MAG: hypothetical protein QGG36_10250 [Pirellulaceae bacterium]|jgi:hypothetical protein|nr:hypothetical protein [Pirellulaceae bacterium]MDP7016171.1 hypothetical protein [Pirellulaceae bacterium]
MAFLIGVDEAGYGPNLGPLVIGGSVWEVPDELLDDHEGLVAAVSNCIAETGGDGRLAVADSKQLYKPKGPLTQLEMGVHVALALTGRLGRTWRELFAVLAPACRTEMDDTPWYRGFDEELPVDADLDRISEIAQAVELRLADAGVRLCTLQTDVVCAGRFNRLLQQWDGKGGLLSNTTLDLVQQLLEHTTGQTLIHCDKQGGRNKYAPLLQGRFTDYLVEIRCEGRAESRYQWGPRGETTICRFVAKGDRFLPAALASMAAKYLRELAMRAFNAYWRRHVSDLKATAGYPLDAKRFREDVAEARAELGIADELFWREK